MPRPRRIFTDIYPYHVTSHLVDEIQFGSAEMDLCLNVLRRTKQKFGVDIIAYHFMGTHYHLILKTNQHTLDAAMKFFNWTVSRKYNHVNDRKGHVWRERYFPKMIRTDGQLLVCMRYVDRNSFVAGLVQDPLEWKWSSLREYSAKDNIDLVTLPYVFEVMGETHDSRFARYLRLVMTPIPADKIPKEWEIAKSL